MRRKSFLVNFLLFFLLTCCISSNVNANNYGIGVSEDQELIWKCKVCNRIEMNNIFGSSWNDYGILKNLSQGKMMKWKINNIDVNQTLVKINFSIWEWTSESIWGVKDNDSEISFFANPSDYLQELNFSHYSSFAPFLFPIPIGEYIGELSLNEWYDVDNRVLPTMNVVIRKDELSPGFPSRDINIIAIYNNQGILSSYKLYIEGNTVIIDIAFDFLPIYVIPALVGLVCILSLSTILYFLKKRKFVKK